MISISNLSVHFVGNYLFDGITLTIKDRDKIGLVGKNGAGKSTLLKILAGLQKAESGNVSFLPDVTLGYLPQEGIIESDKTVYDETATAFGEVLELEQRIQRLGEDIATRTDFESKGYEKALNDLSDANERYDLLGGNTMHADIERILRGLGFSHADMKRPTSEFSGGWQMRIELAKILLRRPSCILLDEPTNHLDIDSIQWLEDFLKNYHGALMLVSHDRAFLDTITNRTIEISNGKVYDYNASYSAYVEMRRERRALQMAAYKNQQKQIAQTERFIERFRAKNTKATQVQSRIKQLEKLDRIEVDDEDTSSIHFRFPPAPRSGKVVAEMKGLSKHYGSKQVLQDIDLVIERQERLAFVGKNGAGKSTLSKILCGLEEHEGTFTTGHNVSIGYYAQHQAEMLDPNATVFDIIDRAARGEMRTRIRDLLGAFLFSGDTVDKKVKVLSGGEKSRLALAKLLLEPVNFLILDEPTNHLDMMSKDILKQALLDFDGAMVVVSHDREFLQDLTGKVLEFREGRIKEYFGDIYEFLRAHNLETMRELERTEKPNRHSPESGTAQKATTAAENKAQWEERKKRRNEERRIERAIAECETAVSRLEEQVAELESRIGQTDFYASERAEEQLQLYERTKEQLEERMLEWSELSEQKEALGS